MKSILIIGNNGQVSQYLQTALSTEYDVYATSRADLDLLNTQKIKASLNELFDKYSPSIIINPAAYTAVDLAEQEPDLACKINTLAITQLGQFCAQQNVPLIHFSTDYVFDGEADAAYLETDIPAPTGVYGQTKLDGEQALIDSKASAIILRTAWVYSNKGKNFYNTMLNLAKSRDELSVVNDQVGAPTYAGSIANGVKQIVDVIVEQGFIAQTQQGIYHFTCQGQTTWCDFAKGIFENSSLAVNVNGIPSSEYPTPAKRPSYSVLNGEKLATVFGIQLPEWRDALNDCVFETQQLASSAMQNETKV